MRGFADRENTEMTEFQPFEIYYSQGKDKELKDLQQISVEGDPSQRKVIDIFQAEEDEKNEEESDIDSLNLKMVFYQEGKVNNL